MIKVKLDEKIKRNMDKIDSLAKKYKVKVSIINPFDNKETVIADHLKK